MADRAFVMLRSGQRTEVRLPPIPNVLELAAAEGRRPVPLGEVSDSGLLHLARIWQEALLDRARALRHQRP